MHAAVTLDVVVNLHGHLDLLKLERKAGVYYKHRVLVNTQKES